MADKDHLAEEEERQQIEIFKVKKLIQCAPRLPPQRPPSPQPRHALTSWVALFARYLSAPGRLRRRGATGRR